MRSLYNKFLNMKASLALFCFLLTVIMGCDVFEETGGLGEALRGIAIGVVDMQGAPAPDDYEGSDCFRDMDKLAKKLTLIYDSFT
jgi:hypothetical protein